MSLQLFQPAAGLPNVVSQSLSSVGTINATTTLALVDPTGGGFTATLPSAANYVGQLVIKNTGSSTTNYVTIDANSTETIDGVLTFVLTAPNQSLVIVPTSSTTWAIVDFDPAGEMRSSNSQSTTNWPFAAGDWGDLTSIVIPQGTWEFSAYLEVVNNGALASNTRISVGISTTSGNSAVGLTNSINRADFITIITSGYAINTQVVGNRVINASATTTYYLKGRSSAIQTNLQYAAFNFVAWRRA